VITYHSDPLDTDSDNDGYTDFDEVLYGGNPNDSSLLPQPLYNYSQTFEGTPNLAAWTTPTGMSGGAWTVDASQANTGTKSFKSATTGPSQTSSVKFRGFFRPGTLTYWAKVDNGSYYNHMYVLVDGVQWQYLTSSGWNSYSLSLTLGIHEIEWRYETYSYGSQPSDSAWIDDVVFTAQ
jgi:hypothetical protein